MAKGLLRSWWNRFRGRLEPIPCPFSQARVLDSKLRSLVASPQRVLGAFELAPGERVLEVGPGTGYYSIAAARRVGESGLLVCLDVQREMLLETRRRLGAGGNLRAAFIHADVSALPLGTGSFDHVFLITVLGEFPNRWRALVELRRVLRPGGRLSVSEQLPDPDFISRGRLRRELGALGFTEIATRGRFFYTSSWKALPQSSPSSSIQR